MKELKEKELEQIEGGGVSFGLLAGIGVAITFIAGIIDGYVNPIKCHN